MNEDNRELRERMTQLSDDELLTMLLVESSEYRAEALGYAKAELESRGVDIAQAAGGANESDGEPVETDLDGHGRPGPVCLHCGGPLRAGTLVSEKELIIVFTDTREERFVNATACRECGHVSLAVDYDNEVQP